MPDKNVLWQVLERLGVHGSMLQEVKSLYDNSQLCVKVQGRTGQKCAVPNRSQAGMPTQPHIVRVVCRWVAKILGCTVPGHWSSAQRWAQGA